MNRVLVSAAQLSAVLLMGGLLSGFTGGGCGGNEPVDILPITCDQLGETDCLASPVCEADYAVSDCACLPCAPDQKDCPPCTCTGARTFMGCHLLKKAPPPPACAGLSESACALRTDCRPVYDTQGGTAVDAGTPTGSSIAPPPPHDCGAPTYLGCEDAKPLPPVCPAVLCDLYCGSAGMKVDANGCLTCECNTGCTTDADCGAGSICVFNGGSAPACKPGENCPTVEVDPTGVCMKAPGCSSDADCAAGQTCMMYAVACAPDAKCPPAQGVCELRSCTSDKDCTGGTTCQADPTDPCKGDKACLVYLPARLVCLPPPVKPCQSDADCGANELCAHTLGACPPGAPCNTGGECIAKTCTSDKDCSAGTTCQPDPNDPCNGPTVDCFAAGRMICLPGLPPPPPPVPTCKSDADCAMGESCLPDPTDPCNQPGTMCFAPGRTTCQAKPQKLCGSDTDCGAGEFCSLPDPICPPGSKCPTVAGVCEPKLCKTSSDCSGGTTCQPDPRDPCNQPNVRCMQPGSTVCLPQTSKCGSLDEKTCGATSGCHAVYGPSSCDPMNGCTKDLVFKRCE